MLVVDGAPVPGLAAQTNLTWGFTGPANKPEVWRSGLGQRSDGSIVWVGGDRLSPLSLAQTLVRAGCVRGMQLEINHPWVQLDFYARGADGRVHGAKALTAMQHTGDRWLTPDGRDFVAAFVQTDTATSDPAPAGTDATLTVTHTAPR
jgi:hypothetical protein